MTFNVTKNGSAIFITGQWTLPISIELAKKIFANYYENSPNDGLFEIPGTDKICLSIMPSDVAKVALSEDDIKALRKVLSSV